MSWEANKEHHARPNHPHAFPHPLYFLEKPAHQALQLHTNTHR